MFQLLQLLHPNLQIHYLLETMLPPSDVMAWRDLATDIITILLWTLCNVIMSILVCQAVLWSPIVLIILTDGLDLRPVHLEVWLGRN